MLTTCVISSPCLDKKYWAIFYLIIVIHGKEFGNMSEQSTNFDIEWK